MKHFLHHLPFLLFILLLSPWFPPAVSSTLSAMADHSQHMEYIWLVPALSLFLVWKRRKLLWSIIQQPAPAPLSALPIFILACGFLFLGFRGGQSRFLQVAAILIIMALPLACYGRNLFKALFFPVILLVFIIPIGFLDNFTVPLRYASVSATTFILNGLGIAVRQIGTAIVSTSVIPFQLDVADPCSGIRSIIALFVGSAAYGAIALNSSWRRLLLFGLSIPIAFLGNVIRLLLTAMTCYFINQRAGMMLHDHALFIIAPFYLLIFFIVTDWLKRSDIKTNPLEKLSQSKMLAPKKHTYALLLLMAILLNLFQYYTSKMPPLVFESDAFLSKTFMSLPNATMEYPWFCQNRICLYAFNLNESHTRPAHCPQCEGELRPISKAELDILPADTQCRKVTYIFSNGEIFTVSLVIAGQSRMSIHRPELCLPSQGFVLSERNIIHLSKSVPMATFALRKEGSLGTSGFAYLFLNSKIATVSNIKRVLGDCLERSICNRIPRWAMITIQSPNHDFQTAEGELALRHFMTLFYPTLFTEDRTL